MGIGGLKAKIDEHEERIARLEKLAEINMQETILLKRETREFKREMREFKNEMRLFKDEMRAFKDEMRAFKDEMLAFKDEMRAFKDEMQEFKEWSKQNIEEIRKSSKEFEEWSKQNIKEIRESSERFKNEMQEFKEWAKQNIEEIRKSSKEFEEWSKQNIEEIRKDTKAFEEWSKQNIKEIREDTKSFEEWAKKNIEEMRKDSKAFEEWAKKNIEEMRKQWGHLAQKMGTMVEDIVAPALPYAVKRRLKTKIVEQSVRVTKEVNNDFYEVDIIAITKEGTVLVVEVKSSFRSRDIDLFEKSLKRFTEFFPQYKERRIVGVIASLNLNEGIVRRATKRGMLAMAMSGDYMDFLNADEVKLL